MTSGVVGGIARASRARRWRRRPPCPARLATTALLSVIVRTFAMDQAREDGRRARILYVEALGHPALSRRRAETDRHLVELVARDVGAGPPARLAAAIVVGGLNEALMAWLDGRIELDRARLVDDTTALLLAVQDAAGDIARARSTSTPVTPVGGGKGGALP
jgi:hypothetical protein